MLLRATECGCICKRSARRPLEADEERRLARLVAEGIEAATTIDAGSVDDAERRQFLRQVSRGRVLVMH